MIRLLPAVAAAAVATAATTEELFLKSGGRATGESVSMLQAPDELGGQEAGNVLVMTFAVRNWSARHLEQDARSLCMLHGQTTYAALRDTWQRREDVRGKMDLLGVDVDAELVGVEVRLQTSVQEDGIAVWRGMLFDMRSLSKCRPVEK